MRGLTDLESLNVEFLNSHGVEYTTVCLTANILDHGIFDASKPIKTYLKDIGVHDFDSQKPGEKVLIPTHIISFKEDVLCKASLYRAGKRGDKRMWFGSDIYSFVDEDQICAIVAHDKELYVFNISSVDIELCYNSGVSNPIKTLLRR